MATATATRMRRPEDAKQGDEEMLSCGHCCSPLRMQLELSAGVGVQDFCQRAGGWMVGLGETHAPPQGSPSPPVIQTIPYSSQSTSAGTRHCNSRPRAKHLNAAAPEGIYKAAWPPRARALSLCIIVACPALL